MVGHACPTPLGRGAGARLKALRAGFRVFFQERILSRGEAFRGRLSNVSTGRDFRPHGIPVAAPTCGRWVKGGGTR
jgi:hypothetical protein